MSTTTTPSSSDWGMNSITNAWNTAKQKAAAFAESAKQQTANAWNTASQKTGEAFNAVKSTVSGTPSQQMAGRRRTRRKKRGGNTVATTAAPVHGLQVAKPTYWIKGGTRRRTKRKGSKKRKTRRQRK